MQSNYALKESFNYQAASTLRAANTLININWCLYDMVICQYRMIVMIQMGWNCGF